MKRIVMGFVTLALTVIAAYGQAPSKQPARFKCNLMGANSPTVRGVRLGMSLEQLLALFPGSTKRKEMKDPLEKAKAPGSNETVYLSFAPATDASKEEFAGVDSVSVGLYKGKVADLSVVYVGVTWKTIDEWVQKVSESFKLPGPQKWAAGPNENPNKILSCDGGEIEAGIQGGGSSIRIRDTAHQEGMEENTKAAEKKKRREFKP